VTFRDGAAASEKKNGTERMVHMVFDYKKEYKEFYLPPDRPELIEVPPMRYLAVRGGGDPNEEGGAYQKAMGLLYGMAYTIKMSRKAGRAIDGFFDYVVPPLEGFWWMEGASGADYTRKSDFRWISVIRLPDFVGREDFDWAAGEAARKKKEDFSSVEFLPYSEGLCVQCMHLGPYDDEPATIRRMEKYARERGYGIDITDTRLHHEIYLGDARKGDPAKRRTVIRHPVKKR